MRLLKTHSHTSERLGYEAAPGRTRRKATEGKRWRYDDSHTSRGPPACRRGGRDEEMRFKENAGAMIRETNVKTLPRTASVAGGRDEERRKLTRNGKVAQPAVPRGGKVPS